MDESLLKLTAIQRVSLDIAGKVLICLHSFMYLCLSLSLCVCVCLSRTHTTCALFNTYSLFSSLSLLLSPQLDMPLMCVMKPEDLKLDDKGKPVKAKGFLNKFKKMKTKAKKAKKKALLKTGLKSFYRLYLLCDGKDGDCDHVHEG